MMKYLSVFWALALSLLSANTFAVNYQLSGLGTLGGGSSLAYGLNDSGIVVGQSFNPSSGLNEAVVWAGGSIQSLGFEGIARAVNNTGTVVGVNGPASFGRAYSWHSGAYSDLGTLGGAYANAYDINDAGVITGVSLTSPQNNGNPEVFYTHGFSYQNGTMEDLGTHSSPLGYSRGHGINESGAITGRASLVEFIDSQKHAAIWPDDGSGIISIAAINSYSTGQDVNDAGIVVGNGYDADFSMRALLIQDGVASLMDSFGGSDSRAFAINNDGVIVGKSDTTQGTSLATVSFDGTGISDLNMLVDDLSGWLTLNVAYDVNELGQIVGYGTRLDGSTEAFLLSPTVVPLPSAFILFGSAIAGLVLRKRYRTRLH